MPDEMLQSCQAALRGAYAEQIKKVFAGLCMELGNADSDEARAATVQRAAGGMRLATEALRLALEASEEAVKPI